MNKPDNIILTFRLLVPVAFVFNMFANICLFANPHPPLPLPTLFFHVGTMLVLTGGVIYSICLNYMDSELRDPVARFKDAR